ncbi:MAG TPA: CARDB domain-containing protein, partial [Methanothrix sp.]|nr:CARDB domain-containing protein [Methanothrix sp.]
MRIDTWVFSELMLLGVLCVVLTIAVIPATEANELQIDCQDFCFSFGEELIPGDSLPFNNRGDIFEPLELVSFPESHLVSNSKFEHSEAGEVSDSVTSTADLDLNDNIAFDTAYNATNPDYRISDSPYMRLTDIEDWIPITPPEPREVEGIEGPTAVEIYDVATGDSTIIPIDDTTRQVVETDSNSTPPFEGLLPAGVMPLTVFPPDDRVQIADTTVYPWRTICRLIIAFPDSSDEYIGSGAIIGCDDGHGYHVLTAGHCVYDSSLGGWASSIKVVPGLDGNYMPYYYSWATYLRSYTDWTQNKDQRHDWAVITLDRNLGDFTGWMGRQTASSLDTIYTGTLNTAGYPGDKGGITMWFDADNGRTADEHNHWYYMDTYGGQSGSPVWRFVDPNRYILTVHAYGDQGSGSNKGTRLNQDKYDRIITWCNEDTPPTDKADLIDDGQAYSGFSPTTITPSQNFQVWCDVRNIGTSDSGGFYVSYYASTNNVISTSDYLIGSSYVSAISPFQYRDSSWSGSFPSIPAGTYYVGWIIDRNSQVSEFDENNNIAYKDSYQLVVNAANLPPNKPTTPSGSGSGNPGVSYSYSTSATDPNGDQVKYTFDWGDGATSETGFVNSGTIASRSHSWSSAGTYSVKAKATDTNGAVSSWSDAKTVTISQPNLPPNKPTTPSGSGSGNP